MTTIAPNTATTTLKKLFDAQVAALAGLAPEDELIALYPLLKKIDKVTEGEGRIPFVIVPQTPTLTFAERMTKVVLGGKTGASYLDDNRVTNLDPIPQGHYLAVDIEDGRAMLETSPNVCLLRFRHDNRFGGTTIEGISLVTCHPEILQHHSIDLPGSHCAVTDVPYLSDNVGPKLGDGWIGHVNMDFGSLSCGSRLGLKTRSWLI